MKNTLVKVLAGIVVIPVMVIVALVFVVAVVPAVIFGLITGDYKVIYNKD